MISQPGVFVSFETVKMNLTHCDFGVISASELNDSIKVCVRYVQNNSFTEEQKKIKLKQACKSKIQRLDPFIAGRDTASWRLTLSYITSVLWLSSHNITND